MADPRDYQMANPRDYHMAESSGYQMADPVGYPRNNQPAEPRIDQMGCPLLHARLTSDNYENACSLAEQMNRGPPTMYYEDHVYYKAQVQGGRLMMKMNGSCETSLNRNDTNVPELEFPGVVRRLIGRGTDEPLLFTVNETRKSSQLHDMLANSVGILRRVERNRKRYKADRANIIIDTVKGIGHFVEITVSLGPGQTVDEGKSVGTFILKALGINEEHRIAPFCEYIDLEPWPVHKEIKSRHPVMQ